MPERSPDTKRLSYACDAIAVFLSLIILLAAVGAKTILTAPGSFLFDRFHLASLYFPGLFHLSGLLIRSGRLPRRTMWMLWLSPLPFLNSAILLQLIFGNTGLLASRVLLDALGRIPAAVLFLFLLSLEILGMVKLAAQFDDPEDRLLSLTGIKQRFQNIMRFLGLDENDFDDVPAGGEEPTLEDRPPMSFPPFPDAPEPIRDVSPAFPEAPEKPHPPGSPALDPVVSELIQRALTGSGSLSSKTAKSGIKPEEAPLRSAFPVPDDMTPAPADIRGYGGGDLDAGIADVLSGPHPAVFDEIPAEREEDPAFSFLAGEELFEFNDDLPEEERESEDISDKLDPAGTGPIGVIADKKPKVRARKRRKYEVPVNGILAEYPDSDFASIDENTRRGADVLEQTLKEFKIEAKVTGIRKGPVITMYELLPSPGVKISSIVNLQDNIALRLAASRVRMVAPIPGKHAIGIEVPNKKRAIVSFSSLVESEEFRDFDSGIPVILGKDISGGNQVIDLTRTPHLLIAGATGSGKSVCVNSLIGSILYSRTPREVKMIMVDPKIVELKLYNDIPHLLAPVITEPKRAIQALQWCLYEMERRYSLLDSQGVRDMASYNRRVKDRKLATEPLPYIVVIVDEFADLMATSGKELEGIVARLAAMSRAVGIHLVLATQRPSVDVITGLIKANFPSRIAFMVAGKTDSRIIIDTMGAEKLLGRGDMLFTSAWDPFPSRMQGAFLAEEEVERLSDHVKTLGEPEYIEDEMFIDDDDSSEFQLEAASGDDPMYDKALEIVVSSRKASASYLQRRLKIGYNRAARLVEEMERRGIVGPANGSKPRDLIHIPERFAAGQGPGEDREPSSA